MSHGASKDMLAAAAKADALKADYEEETNKFEACQVSVFFFFFYAVVKTIYCEYTVLTVFNL